MSKLSNSKIDLFLLGEQKQSERPTPINKIRSINNMENIRSTSISQEKQTPDHQSVYRNNQSTETDQHRRSKNETGQQEYNNRDLNRSSINYSVLATEQPQNQRQKNHSQRKPEEKDHRNHVGFCLANGRPQKPPETVKNSRRRN